MLEVLDLKVVKNSFQDKLSFPSAIVSKPYIWLSLVGTLVALILSSKVANTFSYVGGKSLEFNWQRIVSLFSINFYFTIIDFFMHNFNQSF